MEIRAKCKFDMDTIKDFTNFTLYSKGVNPRKRFITWLIVSVLLALVAVLELIIFSVVKMIAVLFLAILLFLLQCFLYFVLPKIKYKTLAKMKETENGYIFCEDVLKTFTTSEEYNGEAEVKYSLFIKVYETSEYFFLYQTNNQVLLVDKSTIEGGNAEDIRNRLIAFVKEKYILCNY